MEISEIPVQWRIETWFPELGPDIQSRLKAYHTELVKFNKTLNLVSPKTVPFADALHFADSIMASRVINMAHPDISHLYDLGSGNGFPGLVLAILNPKMKLTLVDSDQRKCEFLKHIVNQVKLTNVEVMNCKIEELKEGTVSFAISRGLASISKSLLLLRKTIPKGGVLFHMKGEQWAMELSEIPIQLCSLWNPALLGEYRLPVGEVRFAIVKTDKIG